jgi:hypothetical protein
MFSAFLNTKIFCSRMASLYVYIRTTFSERTLTISIKFVWSVSSISFADPHRVCRHENNATPESRCHKSATLSSSIMLFLKSSLLSAETKLIFYFKAKFREHTTFFNAFNMPTMTHVCVMHVVYIQNSDMGTPSGTPFGSQRKYRSIRNLDIY